MKDAAAYGPIDGINGARLTSQHSLKAEGMLSLAPPMADRRDERHMEWGKQIVRPVGLRMSQRISICSVGSGPTRSGPAGATTAGAGPDGAEKRSEVKWLTPSQDRIELSWCPHHLEDAMNFASPIRMPDALGQASSNTGLPPPRICLLTSSELPDVRLLFAGLDQESRFHRFGLHTSDDNVRTC
jgi:hypothetical protein